MKETISCRDAYDNLLDWLHEQALKEIDIPELQSGVIALLKKLDIPITRMHIGFPTLHPLYAIGAYNWSEQEGSRSMVFSRGTAKNDSWLRSPVRAVYDSGEDEQRFLLSSNVDLSEFPLLEEIREAGATDYLVQLTNFPDRGKPVEQQKGVVMCWTTQASDGFDDADLELLGRLRMPLAIQLMNLARKELISNVLNAYLGTSSAQKVLSGQIQRGDGDVIDAVVMFCDLRGSSKLAENYDLSGFLGLLNQYYEVTAGAVVKHGGEILRFIGDASLAIFPFDNFKDNEAACRAALDAAQEAVALGAEMNKNRSVQGEPEIDFGIGLHPGTVMYGNIGTDRRLEFTVIGKAANEAARIESKCKDLGEQILVSDAFVGLLPNDWQSHGEFDLRNIAIPIEIYSPS